MGPEDTPKWRHPSNGTRSAPVHICHGCGTSIVLWHCAETGCPWCAKCGTKAQPKEKK